MYVGNALVTFWFSFSLSRCVHIALIPVAHSAGKCNDPSDPETESSVERAIQPTRYVNMGTTIPFRWPQ